MQDWAKVIKRNEDYIKTKNNIKNTNREYHLQKLGITENLETIFKPVVDIQKNEGEKTRELLRSTIQPSNENQLLSIELLKEKETQLNPNIVFFHNAALLNIFPQINKNIDNLKTFKPIVEGNFFKINTSIYALGEENGDRFIKDHKGTRIELTNNLLQLLNGKEYSEDIPINDYENYYEILNNSNVSRNALRYKRLKQIILDPKLQQGNFSGTSLGGRESSLCVQKPSSPIIISDNINELKNRLEILLAAYKEGHHSSFNEINAILKTLFEKKVITTKDYKNILSKM